MTKSNAYWNTESRYPLADWQYQVQCGDTRRGYADWVAAQREEHASPEEVTHRDTMIERIVATIDGWDLDTTVSYAMDMMSEALNRLTDEELAEEYRQCCVGDNEEVEEVSHA